MKFIIEEELNIRKFQSLLNDVSEQSSDILNELELMAIDEVKSYLKNRFDVDLIFSRTENNRSPIIKRIVIDFIIYFLWDRTNSNEKPFSMQDRYDKNVAWLRDVAKGLISPELPKLENGVDKTSMFKGGSVASFNNIDTI